MHVTFIGCPFQTSYGSYISRLGDALKGNPGITVSWVASNCGCGDPIERRRLFITEPDAYFEVPALSDYRSSKKIRAALRFRARHFLGGLRARGYSTNLDRNTSVAHFQQTLVAYGSDVVFQWLGRADGVSKVVTVHELDNDQLVNPQSNTQYNRADAIIVHDEGIRTKLIGFGVDGERIHLVCHGARLPQDPPLAIDQRTHIVFYGGHKLMQGKGLDTLLNAYSQLRAVMGDATPLLIIHGHYGDTTPQDALELAARHHVENEIIWKNQISIEDMERLYATAQLCVLPYTGSFAGLPAATAAAHGLPVIGTTKAGIPAHLGDHFYPVAPDDPTELRDAMRTVLDDPVVWQRLSDASFRHAAAELSWEAIARKTLRVYSGSRAGSDPPPRN